MSECVGLGVGGGGAKDGGQINWGKNHGMKQLCSGGVSCNHLRCFFLLK